MTNKQQFPEPTVGTIILNRENEIFLMQSHKWRNKYVIPGGHIELGETMADALKREIREETGRNLFLTRRFGRNGISSSSISSAGRNLLK